MIPSSTISRIREGVDLAAIASDYTRLRKTPGRWIGLCPFHKESTPSFGVRENGLWKCFGCGSGGDVFSFLMKAEGIGFNDAAKILADRVGISLDHDRSVPRVSSAYQKEQSEFCAWWWKKRLEVLTRVGFNFVDDGDSDTFESVLRHAQNLGPTEKYDIFTREATAEDRKRWKDEVTGVLDYWMTTRKL